MKKIILKLIKKYQNTPGRFHNKCKYIPTCSEYSYIAIERFGVIRGGFLSIIRIIKCNPFSKGGIDLVKERK